MSSPLFCYVWEPELNTDDREAKVCPWRPGLIYLRPRLSVSQDGGCGPKELPRNLGLDPILRRILFGNRVTEARPSIKSRLPHLHARPTEPSGRRNRHPSMLPF